MSDGGAPGMDRRETHRPRFYAPVEIEIGGQKLKTRSQDLSQEGMLVETGEPLPEGTEFHARIFIADVDPIEADCVVKRHLRGVGMGVEFVEMSPADRVQLRKLLAGLPH